MFSLLIRDHPVYFTSDLDVTTDTWKLFPQLTKLLRLTMWRSSKDMARLSLRRPAHPAFIYLPSTPTTIYCRTATLMRLWSWHMDLLSATTQAETTGSCLSSRKYFLYFMIMLKGSRKPSSGRRRASWESRTWSTGQGAVYSSLQTTTTRCFSAASTRTRRILRYGTHAHLRHRHADQFAITSSIRVRVQT